MLRKTVLIIGFVHLAIACVLVVMDKGWGETLVITGTVYICTYAILGEIEKLKKN